MKFFVANNRIEVTKIHQVIGRVQVKTGSFTIIQGETNKLE